MISSNGVVGSMATIALLLLVQIDYTLAAKWVTFTIPDCTAGDCTFEYHHANGKTTKKSWKEARNLCRKKYGSDLVSITSAEEQAFVATLGSGSTWIGTRRDAVTKDFEAFSDGSPIMFSAWALGEPNNHKRREDCVLLQKKGRLWNDAQCQKKARYVCKRQYRPVITTTTTEEPAVSTETPALTTMADSGTEPPTPYCSFKNPQGCCLSADGGEGDYYEVEKEDLLLLGGAGVGCKQMCTENPSCTGYEVHKATGRCEIHTGDISYVEQNVQLKCRCHKKDVAGGSYTNGNCNKPTTTTTTPCVGPDCTTSTSTSTTTSTSSTTRTSTSSSTTDTSTSSTSTTTTATTTTTSSTTPTSTTSTSTTTSTTTSTSTTSTTTPCVASPTCSLAQCEGNGAEITLEICPDSVFNVPGDSKTFTYPLGRCSCLQGFRVLGQGCEAAENCCPDTFTGQCAP